MAKVLVIGGGGREHAISWKLAKSPLVKTVFVTPGSAAIAQEKKVENVEVYSKNFEKIVEFCKKYHVDLVAVGPEDPLANGIADYLTKNGIRVFGPSRDASMIESDKEWAKAFMDKNKIPTAKWQAFADADSAKKFINSSDFPALVVKASGLAAGKGVVVAKDKQEACKAVDEMLREKKFGKAGEIIVIEELLQGEECSILAFCDGNSFKLMLPAQDHKRIFDGDEGPNTGGMGVVCPSTLADEELENIKTNVFFKAIEGFKNDGINYVGVLYAGLMMTPSGPKVLEFNCRFGDPETEVILPLLESDLYKIMHACCNKTLHKVEVNFKKNVTAVGVVMASRGYPETSSKGQEITGLEEVKKKENHQVFHCGTDLKLNKLVTNGGRVLIVVCTTPNVTTSALLATKACEEIQFDGKQFRKDIGHKQIVRSILESGKLTYKTSGVDISAGDELVSHIKPAAKSTNRPGSVGSLGGFGGLFDCQLAGYKEVLLVSGTDGVGTKLKIAQELNKHSTIGIDLVAMCVNDILAHGAEPLFFLDYFACGKLDINVAKEVITGISEGCRLSNCSLVGGETAEMPGFYPPGKYDLAGFSVGAVEKSMVLPRTSEIKDGDLVIGLPSSGLHSNGFSLCNKVLGLSGSTYRDVAPFSADGKSFGEEFLTPTKLYVRTVLKAMKLRKIKAFAHITGGGLLENIPRILPEGFGVELDAKKWTIPRVFPWIAATGNVNSLEMLRTFNCGIGAVLIIKKEHQGEVLSVLKEDEPSVIGQVVSSKPGVEVKNFNEAMAPLMGPYLGDALSLIQLEKKKVGVLISGSGTNLQALIDATMDPERRIGAEIVLVISNKAGVEGLKRAEKANIPTLVLNHKNYNTREEFDQEMDKNLVKHGVEIICLAGFMRILSAEFTNKWRGKLLNVHPALLPAFKGTKAQKQALDAGVKVAGCSVHFVNEEVDAGAIIAQEVVPIELNDTVETLTERIKLVEHKAFPEALKLVASGKAKLGLDNKIIWS